MQKLYKISILPALIFAFSQPLSCSDEVDSGESFTSSGSVRFEWGSGLEPAGTYFSDEEDCEEPKEVTPAFFESDEEVDLKKPSETVEDSPSTSPDERPAGRRQLTQAQTSWANPINTVEDVERQMAGLKLENKDK